MLFDTSAGVAAEAVMCMAFSTLTPAPPIAPAASKAMTKLVFFNAADFMNESFGLKAHIGAVAHDYAASALSES